MTTLFVFARDERNDILAVADWGQKLSFYQLSGKQVCFTKCIREWRVISDSVLCPVLKVFAY